MTDLNATWNEATRGPRMSEATGKVIFKYQMPVKEVFSIDLPKDAQIIRIADLDGMFWLWAIVDTNAPMEARHFRAFKTGAKIPDDFDTSHYLGMCAVFVQMELGLYIFEDVQAKQQLDRCLDRFKVVEIPAGKSAIVKDIAERLGKTVIDVKTSTMEPTDLRGFPSYIKEGPNGRFFDWGKLASDTLGYDIYGPGPGKSIHLNDGPTFQEYVMDIDQVLSDFHDVFGPLFEAKFRKPLTQKRIDEIESQGGFDEEEA